MEAYMDFPYLELYSSPSCLLHLGTPFLPFTHLMDPDFGPVFLSSLQNDPSLLMALCFRCLSTASISLSLSSQIRLTLSFTFYRIPVISLSLTLFNIFSFSLSHPIPLMPREVRSMSTAEIEDYSLPLLSIKARGCPETSSAAFPSQMRILSKAKTKLHCLPDTSSTTATTLTPVSCSDVTASTIMIPRVVQPDASPTSGKIPSTYHNDVSTPTPYTSKVLPTSSDEEVESAVCAMVTLRPAKALRSGLSSTPTTDILTARPNVTSDTTIAKTPLSLHFPGSSTPTTTTTTTITTITTAAPTPHIDVYSTTTSKLHPSANMTPRVTKINVETPTSTFVNSASIPTVPSSCTPVQSILPDVPPTSSLQNSPSPLITTHSSAPVANKSSATSRVNTIHQPPSKIKVLLASPSSSSSSSYTTTDTTTSTTSTTTTGTTTTATSPSPFMSAVKPPVSISRCVSASPPIIGHRGHADPSNDLQHFPAIDFYSSSVDRKTSNSDCRRLFKRSSDSSSVSHHANTGIFMKTSHSNGDKLDPLLRPITTIYPLSTFPTFYQNTSPYSPPTTLQNSRAVHAFTLLTNSPSYNSPIMSLGSNYRRSQHPNRKPQHLPHYVNYEKFLYYCRSLFKSLNNTSSCSPLLSLTHHALTQSLNSHNHLPPKSAPNDPDLSTVSNYRVTPTPPNHPLASTNGSKSSSEPMASDNIGLNTLRLPKKTTPPPCLPHPAHSETLHSRSSGFLSYYSVVSSLTQESHTPRPSPEPYVASSPECRSLKSTEFKVRVEIPADRKKSPARIHPSYNAMKNAEATAVCISSTTAATARACYPALVTSANKYTRHNKNVSASPHSTTSMVSLGSSFSDSSSYSLSSTSLSSNTDSTLTGWSSIFSIDTDTDTDTDTESDTSTTTTTTNSFGGSTPNQESSSSSCPFDNHKHPRYKKEDQTPDPETNNSPHPGSTESNPPAPPAMSFASAPSCNHESTKTKSSPSRRRRRSGSRKDASDSCSVSYNQKSTFPPTHSDIRSSLPWSGVDLSINTAIPDVCSHPDNTSFPSCDPCTCAGDFSSRSLETISSSPTIYPDSSSTSCSSHPPERSHSSATTVVSDCALAQPMVTSPVIVPVKSTRSAMSSVSDPHVVTCSYPSGFSSRMRSTAMSRISLSNACSNDTDTTTTCPSSKENKFFNEISVSIPHSGPIETRTCVTSLNQFTPCLRETLLYACHPEHISDFSPITSNIYTTTINNNNNNTDSTSTATSITPATATCINMATGTSISPATAASVTPATTTSIILATSITPASVASITPATSITPVSETSSTSNISTITTDNTDNTDNNTTTPTAVTSITPATANSITQATATSITSATTTYIALTSDTSIKVNEVNASALMEGGSTNADAMESSQDDTSMLPAHWPSIPSSDPSSVSFSPASSSVYSSRTSMVPSSSISSSVHSVPDSSSVVPFKSSSAVQPSSSAPPPIRSSPVQPPLHIIPTTELSSSPKLCSPFETTLSFTSRGTATSVVKPSTFITPATAAPINTATVTSIIPATSTFNTPVTSTFITPATATSIITATVTSITPATSTPITPATATSINPVTVTSITLATATSNTPAIANVTSESCTIQIYSRILKPLMQHMPSLLSLAYPPEYDSQTATPSTSDNRNTGPHLANRDTFVDLINVLTELPCQQCTNADFSYAPVPHLSLQRTYIDLTYVVATRPLQRPDYIDLTHFIKPHIPQRFGYVDLSYVQATLPLQGPGYTDLFYVPRHQIPEYGSYVDLSYVVGSRPSKGPGYNDLFYVPRHHVSQHDSYVQDFRPSRIPAYIDFFNIPKQSPSLNDSYVDISHVQATRPSQGPRYSDLFYIVRHDPSLHFSYVDICQALITEPCAVSRPTHRYHSIAPFGCVDPTYLESFTLVFPLRSLQASMLPQPNIHPQLYICPFPYPRVIQIPFGPTTRIEDDSNPALSNVFAHVRPPKLIPLPLLMPHITEILRV